MNKLMLSSIFLVLMLSSHSTNAQTKPDLKHIDYQQWMTQLEQYQSQIVVVDFWATWCSSCLERFPHMVEMNKTYQPKGVQFVSMLLEDPAEPEAIKRAKQFLTNQFKLNHIKPEQQAGFDHYFMTENLMVSFEKLDLIGIPAVFIYDRKGKLAHRLTGDDPNNQFTEEHIKKALDHMLKN